MERAGLGSLSPDEASRFTAMNRAYASRFGFPFIIAVKGLGKAEILAAFAQRLANSPEAEFNEALTQIARIVLLRLGERMG